MLHFEKALYEDPEQDLNARWWSTSPVSSNFANRPRARPRTGHPSRTSTIAPVYYHNYMLGELFAAQLRHVLAQRAGQPGKAAEPRFDGQREVGDFLRQQVFRPGAAQPWPEFVRTATGEPLSPRYFAAEVGGQ